MTPRSSAVRSTDARTGGPVICPVCRSSLVHERHASPWCERCAWGIDRYDPPAGATWWQRWTGALGHRVAYRLTLAQFRRLTSSTARGVGGPGRATGPWPGWAGTDPTAAGAADGDPRRTHESMGSGTDPRPRRPGPVLRPPRRWSRALVVAVVVALAFYAGLVGLAVLGVRLVLYHFPSPTIALGVVVLAITYVLLPRPRRLAAGAEPLVRADAPTLFGLIDRTAAAVGTRAPAIVAVEPWFNASTTALGARHRRGLVLGLALWGCLDPQQRVALLAHELGHFRQGDIRRGPLIWPAMDALGRLSRLFFGRRALPRGRYGSVGDIMEPLVSLVMRAVAAVFSLAHLGVLAVLLRDSQRREYLADQRSAELAGTTATVQLLDLLVSDVDSVIAARARAQQTRVGWRAAAAEVLAPDHAAKLRRLRQLSTRHDVSLWSTHPPAGLRAWLVEASGWREPAVVLAEEESARIDDELARHYQRARRDLAQSGV